MKDSSDKAGVPRWKSSTVTLHAVQCARCLKWRVIPTKDHYEVIREHITEQPWVCENAITWRPESNCDIPADIQQDQSMLWAIDRPNIPLPPTGWDRQITVRTDGSSKFADVYYISPLGVKLRSKTDIEKYISKNPGTVPPETSIDQFSFAIPRPLPGVCPQLTQAGGKLASPTAQGVHHEHGEPEGLANQSPDGPVFNKDSSPNLTNNTYSIPWDDGTSTAGGGETQQLHQVTPVSPQGMEHRPFSNKHWNPDLPTPTQKRTKQQIKQDRLSMETRVFPGLDRSPEVASTADGTGRKNP